MQQNEKNNVMESEARRSFLKKSVYTAPSLLVLGALTHPNAAHAGFGGPPSDPVGVTSNGSTQPEEKPSDTTNDTASDSLVLDSVQG